MGFSFEERAWIEPWGRGVLRIELGLLHDLGLDLSPRRGEHDARLDEAAPVTLEILMFRLVVPIPRELYER